MSINWKPQYLNTNLAYPSGYKVSAEEFSNLFNLNRIQSNNNTDGIDLIKSNLEAFEANIEEQVAQFTSISLDWNTIQTNVESLVTELQNYTDDVADIRSYLNTLNGTLDSQSSELDALDVRITGAETTVTELSPIVTRTEERISQAESKITDQAIINAVSGVYATQVDFEALDGSITTLIDRISTAELKITAEAIKAVVTEDFATKAEVDLIGGNVTGAQHVADTAQAIATQTASKFSWLVQSGTNATDFILTDRVADLISSEINLTADAINLISEEGNVEDYLLNLASRISTVSNEIILEVESNYVTETALETYRSEIQNLLSITQNSFNFNFSQVTQQLSGLGGEIVKRNQFIRLIEGNIVIGKSDSTITTVITNGSVEFRYNDIVVAKYTNEFLEVENIKTKNQVAFGDDWAIRPGTNGNLNIVWIGG